MSSNKSSNPARVGIVGVGDMGLPVVERLLAAGHQVTAYVRRAEQAPGLEAIGVKIVPSIPDVARDCDFAIVFAYKDEQVREIVLNQGLADAMPPGSILISHTTGSPNTVKDIAKHLAGRGVGVVDAPVSGGPVNIRAGAITLLVGGSVEDVAKCHRIFDDYAKPVLHIGELGSGQLLKLINNTLFGANIQLSFEVAKLARGFGLDVAQVMRALTSCSGNTSVVSLVANLGTPEALIELAGHFVHKDVTVAAGVAAELGTDLGLLSIVNKPLIEATATKVSA